VSLEQRKIDLKFQLGTGAFGEDGSNTVELTGLRCTANITKSGGVSMSSLDLRVYGMPLDVMNKLTILNKLRYTDSRFNSVTVSADGAVCFTGIMSEAWADIQSAPDALFHVSAFTGLLEAVKPVAPVSYNGSVDVATIMAGIAVQMQPIRTLENSGVDVRLADPYLPGTLRDQALAVARAAGINLFIDDTVLAIWPNGESRGGLVPVLSAATGIVGYPQFTQNGIMVRTLYNPSLVFGQTVEVESVLTPANGRWTIAAISHNLDSDVPGGAWFTSIECGLLGQTVAVID
jgi:hypothetical protein